MSNNSISLLSSPPELPPYLKKVYDLKPIIEAPSDEEVIGIHAVIRVANKVVDVEDMGDPVLLAQLSEHLFNVQMAKYRSKHFSNTTYTPPILPSHVTGQLESVIGHPSEEQIIKVQSAIRSYQQFANVPTMFDPHLEMELSQHLFDIQMAKYTQRARQGRVSPLYQAASDPNLSHTSERTLYETKESNSATNNPGSGADAMEQSSCLMDRAIQLVERSNQLIEQSIQITERANQVIGRSGRPVEDSSTLVEKLTDIIEGLNCNSEKTSRLAEEFISPIERLGDILDKINKVLVSIQHAIVRNHKGNTKYALDCLVNEEGETPGISKTVRRWDFGSLFERSFQDTQVIQILINGSVQELHFPNSLTAHFLCFYGIGDELCEEGPTPKLKPGKESSARERLRKYWASCLG